MTFKEILSSDSYNQNKYIKKLYNIYYDIIPDELEYKYVCLNEALIKLRFLIKQNNNLTNELFLFNNLNDNDSNEIKKIKYDLIKVLAEDNCNWDEIINLCDLAKEEKNKISNKKENNRIDIISNSVRLSNTISKVYGILKSIHYLKAKNYKSINEQNKILENLHLYFLSNDLSNEYNNELVNGFRNFIIMRLKCFERLEKLANKTIKSVHKDNDIYIDDYLYVINNSLNNVSYGFIDTLSYLSDVTNYVTLEYFKSGNDIIRIYNDVLDNKKVDLSFLNENLIVNKDMVDKIDVLNNYRSDVVKNKNGG